LGMSKALHCESNNKTP